MKTSTPPIISPPFKLLCVSIVYLALVFALSPRASAALLAYEGFDYQAGGLLAGQGAASPGWTNESGTFTWTDNSGGALIERGSMLYRDAQGNSLATYGNKVRLSGAVGANLVARDTALLRGEDGTTTWLSFLAQRVGPTNAGANPYPGAAYLLLSNTNLVSSPEQVAFGNTAGAAANNWALVPNNAGASAQVTTSPFGQVSLVLVRIDHKAGNDDAFMWVNPALGTAPDTNVVAAKSVGAFDFSFNQISLFAQQAVGANNYAELLVDELRVGETLESVTPYIPVLIAYEGFDYDPASVTNLTGQAGGTGWAGGWGSAGGNPPAFIVAGSLEYTDSLGNKLATSGNRARSVGASDANTSPQPQRDLPNLVGTDGTTSWWSFVGVRTGNPDPWNDGSEPRYRRVSSLQLHDTNPGAAERIAVGRGTETPTTVHDLGPQPWDTWGFYDIASTTRGTYTTNKIDQLAFLLVRIDHKGGNSKDATLQPEDIDEAWLWVNPNLNQEPSTNTARYLGTTLSNATTGAVSPRSDLSFNRLKAFIGGNNQAGAGIANWAEFEFDEIRLGQTFASVAPIVPGAGQPSVSIARSGSQVQVTWSGGALQGAPTVTGAWNTIQGALSPVHTEAIGNTNKFFRAQQ